MINLILNLFILNKVKMKINIDLEYNLQKLKICLNKTFIVFGNKISKIFNQIFHKEKTSSKGYAVSRSKFVKVREPLPTFSIPKQMRSPSPLIIRHWNDASIEKLLLDNHANIDIRDQKGKTALQYAAANGFVELVEALLDKGAYVHARNQAGATALHYAAMQDNLKIAELLLEKEAYIEERDSTGSTPLHYAAMHGKKEITELFLDRGANIEAREDDTGFTPLHHAVTEGKIEIIKLLLEKKADIDSRCNHRFTPLHLAAQEGNLNIVKLLIENGTHVNALNLYGFTPSMLAQVFSHIEVQQLLEEKSGDFGKIWVTQKLLAARFGVLLKVFIEGGITDLQGLDNNMTYPQLVESFQQFLLSKQENKVWAEVDFKNILDTLQSTCPIGKNTEQLMHQLKQQKTVVIPTGWIGHSVGVVIDGDLLFKCNRGNRAQHLPAGILVYKINKRENLKGVIQQLVSNQSQHHFENEIDHQLGLQQIDTINCHDQRVGNCAWASAKLVLRATLYAQLLKKGMPPASAQAEAKKIYKEWSAKDRLLALQDYISLVKGISAPGKGELFTEILKKYDQKQTAIHRALIQDLCKKAMVEV